MFSIVHKRKNREITENFDKYFEIFKNSMHTTGNNKKNVLVPQIYSYFLCTIAIKIN